MAGLGSLINAVLVPSPSPIAEQTAAPLVDASESRRGRARAWLPLGSLIVVYATLAIAYNVSVPLNEAPDEQSHAAYVDSLQRSGRIPDVRQTYEAAGPPLYHATGAAVLKLFGFSSPYIPFERNAEYPTTANFWLHNPGENDFPYRGPVLSIHILRGVSTIFGIGVIVLVYFTTLLLFPGRRLLAWAAGANTALFPQFAFVGASVMNDTAVAFFGAAAVYSSLRVVKEGAPLWVLATAASLALGFLTEASMIVVACVCALALLVSPLSRRSRGLAISALVVVPLGVAGWFYVHNLVEYGSVFPGDLIDDGPAVPLTNEIYREIFLPTLQKSYWYVGGWMNVLVIGAMYQFLDVFAGLALGGLIVVGLRNNLTLLQRRGLLLLTVLFAVAIFEVIWISTRISYSAQGRYLFIAQPAIALMLALGINGLFQKDERDHPVLLLLPAILLGLNVGVLTLTLPSAY